jgi:6-phosphogluconate dehydrogenase
MPDAHWGLAGLAVMGCNLARNIVRHGEPLVVQNRTQSKTDDLLAEHGDEGPMSGATDLADLAASLQPPRRVIVMVKAGKAVDAVVDELAEHLDAGDVIVDGGNSEWVDTERRAAALEERGIHYAGVGISGGEEGALNGPSIMPGGSDEAYELIGPVLERIAADVDGTPCCTHLGPGGAGHYVKMVHNGIEYADMQLIAEVTDLMIRGAGMDAGQAADAYARWNEGELESFLIEITAEVLRQEDADTGTPLVDAIIDEASQKGTGRWTAVSSLELGVPTSGIIEAVMARVVSSQRETRQKAAELLQGPQPDGSLEADQLVDDLEQALYAAKVVAYAQGLEQLAAQSDERGWDLDLGAVATIWRDGCIIRARFLDRIRDAYGEHPDTQSLLFAPFFTQAVADGQAAWRRVVAAAVAHGIPTPVLSSLLAYYDGFRTARLPAWLTQAQRDYFGAHTYRRLDREGSFHTDWPADRVEAHTDG